MVFVSCPQKTPNAVYGSMMAARAQARKAAGSVIDGRFRDLQEQRDLNYPVSFLPIIFQAGRSTFPHPGVGSLCMLTAAQVFARDVGTAPPYELVKVVGVNVPVKLQTDEQDMTINPGDYVVGDLNGVVVLPKELAEEALPLMAKQAEADSQMALEIQKGMSFGEASKKFRT